jgi:hypothetical protein
MAGRAEIEPLTGQGNKIIVPAIRILAFNASKPFFVISTLQEFPHYFCYSIQSKLAITS